MESNSSLLTAPAGAYGQYSAPVHRPPSPSPSTSSSISGPFHPRPPSSCPTFCDREICHSRDCGEYPDLRARYFSKTDSNWPPLPTTNLQSERSREPTPGSQSTPAREERSDSTLSSTYLFPERFTPIRRGDFTIDASGLPRPSPRRGHRRRSTHVTPADLDSFRREVLGIETPPSIVPEEENPSRQNQNPSSDPQFEQLNTAFASATMSLNSASGMSSNNSGSSVFSGYVDNSSVPRPPMSPALSHTSSQVNGGSMPGMNGNVPMNAGHQMDLQHLYDMVLELSDVLKNNREMTKNIVTSAEDLMNRSAADGTAPNAQQVSTEINAARVADLELALAKEKRANEILKHEQAENTKLIGEYEASVGNMVEQIRNYCQNNNMHYLAQKRQYNNLLQAERDAHLESRLDRDFWHAQAMKCSDMIRTAFRLRCEEEDVPIRVVSGLQNEVRAYRQALGMEPEKPEEEYGWEILKDVPPSAE